MKKALRKLIPTLVMVLIAASMVGTSTYAWFSMNTQVTVTGLNITVDSDDTYLLVSTTNTTAAAIQTEDSKTKAVTVADPVVYPCSPALTDDEVGYLTVAEGHNTTAGAAIATAGAKVTTASTAADYKNWFTAQAALPGASAMLAGSAKQLATFDGYVIQQTIYLTVAVGANNANNLQVTATIGGNATAAAATHVLITTDDGGFANLTNATPGTTNVADIKGSNTAITPTTVRTINVYIYVDGDHANIYTNNKANLSNVTVNLAFDVTPVAA